MLKLRWTSAMSLALLLALMSAQQASAQPKEFFFKDGDRIVVMGDSITEQHLYSNYLEMWTVSRFPKQTFTFRNVGIGGDTSGGGNGRFKRDVLAHNATAMTVDFGMNDGGYAKFNEGRFKNYMKGLQGIADQAKAGKVRVAWVTPQPCERGPENSGYNDTLEKFSDDGVKEIALKNEGLFVDQFHPYYAVIKKARESNPKVNVTGGDAVHPGPAGQSLMAASILKGLGFPRVVSSVEVNLTGTGKTLEAKVVHCEATAELIPGGGVTIKRKDRSFPFFPEEAKGIVKFTPLLDDMNDYGLKIVGLAKGDYEVLIDEKKVAQYTGEELAKGVNLAAPALSSGPLAENVKKVWTAVKVKNQYFHDQVYRGVVLAGNKSPIFKGVDPKDIAATRQKVYEERMKKMPELDAAVRRALDSALETEYVIWIRPAKK